MFEYNSPQFPFTQPTATQPYGYPLSTPYPLSQPNQFYPQQPQQQVQRPQMNTNKIFVNGIDDVKNRVLPPNSEYVFLDNDKSILYQKKVDANGQFDVKAFDIVPHVEDKAVEQSSMDLSNYVPRTEFDTLQKEVDTLKTLLMRSDNNGKSNTTPTRPTIPS